MTEGWLYRDRFRKMVDAWLASHEGATKADLARAMGMQESTLVTHYSGNREPGKKTMAKITEFFRVPSNYFVDDPEHKVEGVPQDLVRKLTPAKRMVLYSLAQKLAPDEVTDESAEKTMRAIEELVELGKIPPQK